MSQQEYLYKIGKLYVKSKESEYLNKRYSKFDVTTLTNEEYYKQIQPFIESDHIEIYHINGSGIYSFCIYNYTIYDMLLNYLDLEYENFSHFNKKIYVDYTGDNDEKFDEECIETAKDYCDGKYIPKELFNGNVNIEKKKENCSFIFKLIDIPIDEYNFNMNNKYCRYMNLRYYNNDFWNDIKYIYFNFDISKLMLTISYGFNDRFSEKMKKYIKFFKNIDRTIYNEIDQLLKLNDMIKAAILIDNMNLFDRFSDFYFGENFPNGNPTKEFRIKQINEAIEFQKNFKPPYLFNYFEKIDYNERHCVIPKSANIYSADAFTYEYKDKYILTCGSNMLADNNHAIGLIYTRKCDISIINDVNKYLKQSNLQFLYMPILDIDVIDVSDTITYLKHNHDLKFYNIGNNKMFIGDCGYTKNKYLSNLVIDNSNLFKEYFKIYSNNEIYNLDITAELKNYNIFNELFKNNESAANTINNLIKYVFNEYINDILKDIFYNMYYLQMFDILEMIELITLRKISLNIYEYKDTDKIINECFIKTE